MKYCVLLAGYGEMPLWDSLTPKEQEAGLAKHVEFDEACAAKASTCPERVIESVYRPDSPADPNLRPVIRIFIGHESIGHGTVARRDGEDTRIRCSRT